MENFCINEFQNRKHLTTRFVGEGVANVLKTMCQEGSIELSVGSYSATRIKFTQVGFELSLVSRSYFEEFVDDSEMLNIVPGPYKIEFFYDGDNPSDINAMDAYRKLDKMIYHASDNKQLFPYTRSNTISSLSVAQLILHHIEREIDIQISGWLG